MFFRTTFVCFVFILSQVSAELVLEKDVTETITFEGSELAIEVDNSRGIIGRFTLCIKTSEQVPPLDCPSGYAQIQFNFGRNFDVKIAKMDRQGKVMLNSIEYVTIPPILFDENESLDVILKEVPDQSTKVKLLNAIRYVQPAPVETTTPKKSGSMAVFCVVVIVLLVIAGILIAGLIATIWYCRRKTPQKMEQSDDHGQKHKTTGTVKDNGSSAPLPPKPKSGRTSSTTITTTPLPVKSSLSVAIFPAQNTQSKSSMNTVKPTLSSHASSVPPVVPFDNDPLNNSTNNLAPFKKVSNRGSESALRRSSSQY